MQSQQPKDQVYDQIIQAVLNEATKRKKDLKDAPHLKAKISAVSEVSGLPENEVEMIADHIITRRQKAIEQAKAQRKGKLSAT